MDGASSGFRSVRVGRQISVLYVGASATRGRAAEHLLKKLGFKVTVRMQQAVDNLLSEREGALHDVIAFDAGGRKARVDARIILMRSANGPVETSRDDRACVTDLGGLAGAVKRLLDDGARDAERLQDLIDGLPGVVVRCSLGPEGRIDFVSDPVAALCGHSSWQLVGHNARRLLAIVHPDDRRRVVNVLQRALRDDGSFGIEHRIVCASGEEKWLWHHGCVRRAEAGANDDTELESFIVDITERKYEEQQLAYLASHDSLTGVANRGTFMEQLSKSIQRAQRRGETVACLFLDLDRFKQVNDSFGHGFGDELLRQASQRLRRCIRGNDVIGRFGGDEFTVLLDGINEPRDALKVAQKILDELARPCVIHGHRLALSASIGISCCPGDASDAATLVRNADAAMYSVKSSGRHGCRFHSGRMSEHAFETLSLTNGLRGAIESGQIQLCYQPRVDLRTGCVAAFEALSRWNSPEFGVVSPDRFIALAEDVGLIGKLGDHTLRRACRQLADQQSDALSRARVSVNVSPRQFRDDDFPEQVADVLADTGLAPARLELEIAESTMMQDRDASTAILDRLRQLGVGLSVDDFGTDASSLHLLKRLPLDYLKIHASFIRGVPDDRDDTAVTEAIIAMAKRLGLGVVAQGIETEAQAMFVRSSGCDEGQGFLFSRPLPAGEMRRYPGRQLQ